MEANQLRINHMRIKMSVLGTFLVGII